MDPETQSLGKSGPRLTQALAPKRAEARSELSRLPQSEPRLAQNSGACAKASRGSLRTQPLAPKRAAARSELRRLRQSEPRLAQNSGACAKASRGSLRTQNSELATLCPCSHNSWRS